MARQSGELILKTRDRRDRLGGLRPQHRFLAVALRKNARQSGLNQIAACFKSRNLGFKPRQVLSVRLGKPGGFFARLLLSALKLRLEGGKCVAIL